MKSREITMLFASAVVSAVVGFALQKGLEKITNKNERI